MAVPEVGGYYAFHNSSSTTVDVDISTIPIGGWMLVSVMVSASSTTVTAPAGWTVLHTKETTGTRANVLFGKVKDGADTFPATFTQSTTVQAAYGLLWGVSAGAVDGWIIGTSATRANSGEASGARYTNKAPSVTTTGSDYLAIAISQEATLLETNTREIVSITGSGWNEEFYLAQIAPSDRIETIWMGTKEMASAGATGDVTVVYESPQDNNGWGIQIAIPYEIAEPLQIPQVVGTPTTAISSSATSSISIARPSGILNGDMMVVVIRGQVSDMTVEPSSSGFTRQGPAFVGSTSAYRANGIYTRPIPTASGEPSSYTFTFTSGSGRMIATAFIVRGVDLDSPIAGYYNSYGGDTISGGRSVGSYSINAVPSLALFYGGSEFATPNDHIPSGLPSGYTEFASVTTSTNTGTSRTYMWLGTKVVENTPVPAASITWAGTAAGPAAEGIAFRGSMSAPPDPAGDGITLKNGEGTDVQVFYTTADGARTPASIIPVRRGFDTALQAINTYGSTWAHRGGSSSYPEMSFYGYTQSVVRGYGVLEVSLARTSDGVWFGLHDQTTDRTSGGVYGNASSQTWAQIQAQQITVGPTGAPQPYMRWEEIVEAYGSTHVLVVDPKYALGSYRTEFLNMVYNDIGPERAIIKYSGGGATPSLLSQQAQALGMQTWGFFYAADASAALGGSGALQTYGPNWTTIGMDYTASQAVWDEALALGKPVIAHIVPNQTAYNLALSKGAVGVQVSGVAAVEPVSWWNQTP